MKIQKERVGRLALFSLLALFALLLIGSEHRRPVSVPPSTPAQVAAAMRDEIPAASRAGWDRAADRRPLWLLEVSSICDR